MISERRICDFKKMVNFDKGLPVYVYTVLYTILIAYFLDIETWCLFIITYICELIRMWKHYVLQ